MQAEEDFMHAEGGHPGPSKETRAVPTTDDQIKEKYLERAIRELNQLTRELQECRSCPRGNMMPVLGSGHPQADILLLKHAPTAAEIEEGVAFYGRSGNALVKSFKRLGVDPLAVYGTLCAKCPLSDPELAAPDCVGRLVEEIAIVSPRIIVIMGDRALEILNDLQIPLAVEVEPRVGEIQSLTPTIDVLFVPDIDVSLDTDDSKRAFWGAFRKLGEWYDELPPY